VFIHASSEYIPQRIVDNEYFSALTGRPTEWFEKLTGIRERRRAAEGENANTMAVCAVENLLRTAPGCLEGVDLIIGASYTPWDTIGTIAHVIQRQFAIADARAMYLSTACSSFIDALDVVAAYFAAGRATRALVVAVEHNSLYSSDSDDKSGHLWGDGAAALLLTKTAGGGAVEIVDVRTVGRADLGRGPEGINMIPNREGLVMPYGKDIFMHACREMVAATRTIVAGNALRLEDITMLVPHQANKRIIDCVTEHLQMPSLHVPMTIAELGNTGCAGVAITYHRNAHLLSAGQLAVLVTFGGGYSTGAALLRRPPN
jgi:3-oxoacyl-[acyl-carrier-protein] synthase-3